jgi:hypothetical protein
MAGGADVAILSGGCPEADGFPLSLTVKTVSSGLACIPDDPVSGAMAYNGGPKGTTFNPVRTYAGLQHIRARQLIETSAPAPAGGGRGALSGGR